MRSFSDIASKYIRVHKKRTILTMLGIILAIAFFFAITTLYYSYIDGSIKDIKSRRNYEVMYGQVKGDRVKSIVNNMEVSSSGVIEDYGQGTLVSSKETKPILNIGSLNQGAFNNIFNITLIKGRLPNNDREIIVEDRFIDEVGDLSLSDEISVRMTSIRGRHNTEEAITEKFKIVGIFEPIDESKANNYMIANRLNEDFDKDKNYIVYANLKDPKNKVDIGTKIARDNSLEVGGNNNQVIFNEPLLRMYGQSENPALNQAIKNMIILVTSIIITCTIAGIYNIFAISVVERSRHFGILRSIGATPGQIRKLIVKEALIMGFLSIPMGILAGYIALNFILKTIATLGFNGLDSFNIIIHYKAIITCILIGGVTILLSIWGPAKLASRVTPIDAIRNTSTIKRERIKVRKNKLIRGIFGIEGEIGYKNIRRNPREFWFTIFSLVISIVLFISLTSLISLVNQVDTVDVKARPFEATLSSISSDFSRREIADSILEEIKNLQGVEKVYTPVYYSTISAIEKDKINQRFPIGENKSNINIKIDIEDQNYQFIYNLGISAFDENALKEAKRYLIDGSIDEEGLKNNEILLVQGSKMVKGSKGYNKEVFSTHKVGDKITVPKLNSKRIENQSMFTTINNSLRNKEYDTFTIVGILSENPFFGSRENLTMGFIMSEELYEEVMGEVQYHTAFIRFKSEEHREKLNRYFEALSMNPELNYYDYLKEKEGFYQGLIFYYTVIVIVALMGMISIINTMNINLLVKRREFAVYKAIGMTKKQLRKLLVLQGTLYGIMAAIFGSIIGTAITIWITTSMQSTKDTPIKLPIGIIIIGISGVILVNLLATLIPLKKINHINISESLRFEE